MSETPLPIGALLRLLQLSSPGLPVGGYSYSQGLESAIDAGIVHDARSARDWIGECLELSVSCLDAPILLRLIDAWAGPDAGKIKYWSEFFLAARDTAELRAETAQMGASLAKLLRDLLPEAEAPAMLLAAAEIPLPNAFACASVLFNVPARAALSGFLFAWTENQVLAAVKTVPLGQVAGQRMLLSLTDAIERAIARAESLGDDEISNWTPALSILSMRHETQYSRIFRS